MVSMNKYVLLGSAVMMLSFVGCSKNNSAASKDSGSTAPSQDVVATQVSAQPLAIQMVTGPAENAVTGPETEFTFVALTATGFTCSLDGTPIESCSAAGVILSKLASGTHEFVIQAKDVNDNKGNEFTRTWIVDATGPTVSFDPSEANTGISGIIHYWLDEKATIRLSFDDAPFMDATLDGFEFVTIKAGHHELVVEATDEFGNVSKTKLKWNVDPNLG